ncbi:MAG: hypothetical protein PHN80_11975 [Hespellia sp.]|nr:hypothetical protein [Hespellia sp.]
MNTIIDLMLAIRKGCIYFYHKDTKQFDGNHFSEVERKNLSFDSRLPLNDTNNFRLPSYEEINHKDIMSFYVKEYVEDKVTRKQLFYVLRRYDYMDAYLDKLRELNLYDDFIDTSGDIYMQIFEEWADKNKLNFK